jgi:vacuolar-type H+-ATPase subunit D/Vma8
MQDMRERDTTIASLQDEIEVLKRRIKALEAEVCVCVCVCV